MFLVNTQLTVNWKLRATIYDIPLTDLDIIIKPPQGEGNTVYTNSAIAAEDYIQPTTTTDGFVTYRFTPDSKGLWEVTLTNGVEGNNSIYYTHKIFVDSNDTHTKKFVDGSLI